jgi:hypothetical protein
MTSTNQLSFTAKQHILCQSIKQYQENKGIFRRVLFSDAQIIKQLIDSKDNEAAINTLFTQAETHKGNLQLIKGTLSYAIFKQIRKAMLGYELKHKQIRGAKKLTEVSSSCFSEDKLFTSTGKCNEMPKYVTKMKLRGYGEERLQLIHAVLGGLFFPTPNMNYSLDEWKRLYPTARFFEGQEIWKSSKIAAVHDLFTILAATHVFILDDINVGNILINAAGKATMIDVSNVQANPLYLYKSFDLNFDIDRALLVQNSRDLSHVMQTISQEHIAIEKAPNIPLVQRQNETAARILDLLQIALVPAAAIDHVQCALKIAYGQHDQLNMAVDSHDTNESYINNSVAIIKSNQARFLKHLLNNSQVCKFLHSTPRDEVIDKLDAYFLTLNGGIYYQAITQGQGREAIAIIYQQLQQQLSQSTLL